MRKWSMWRRGTVQCRGTEALSIVLMLLIGALAACGGSVAPHHTSAKATATPHAPKGWSTIPSPGVGQEGSLVGVTALSATAGWAVGQYEGLDSLQRTLTERWNGTQWTYQPSPSPGQEDNILQAVSGSSASDVWAVGYEKGTDATDQPLIEHWTGGAWTVVQVPAVGPAGGQLSGVVAVSPSDAWAVGFARIPVTGGQGGGEQPLIEYWNGSAWSIATGAAIPPPQNNDPPFNTLAAVAALSASNVWAVGTGTTTDTPELIEHWDGRSWALVPGANAAPLSGVAAIAPNDIWAVGPGSTGIALGCAGGGTLAIEHWNGAQWASVPFPQPDPTQGRMSLASVTAFSSSDVWAVGGENVYNTNTGVTIVPTVAHWSGAQWTLLPNPAYRTAYGLASVAAAPGGTLLAVGQYEAANGPAATLAEQGSGGKLAIAASASPGTERNSLSGVAALSAHDVWAVGASADGDLSEHWNGTTWTVSSVPNSAGYDDSLHAVAGASTNDVWAVGNAYRGAAIEHWNGDQWTDVPVPVTTSSATLSGVVALSTSNVWAVGGSATGPVAMHWDGGKWSAVATPTSAPGTYLSDDSLLSVAAAAPNDIWAVGGNPPRGCGGLLPALVEHWNGSSWSVVPGLPPGVLYGVAVVSANDVWAVGSGSNQDLILHWDGTHWSAVAPPASTAHTYLQLQSVAAHGADDVWAVGTTYGDATSGTRNVVQHWDGHAWSNVQVDSPGAVDNSLFGITSVSTGEFWAVGEYEDCLGCGARQALIEHYNP